LKAREKGRTIQTFLTDWRKHVRTVPLNEKRNAQNVRTQKHKK
jgi:hypothetical protein